MLKVSSPRVKTNLQQRLRRIEGQLRGVQRMLDEERDCREIVQQLSAARSALHSASLLFMQQYASDCLLDLDADTPETRQELIDDLISLIGKA